LAVEVENEQVAVAAKQGTKPLTSPLSYRQLNPSHGPASTVDTANELSG
jgi:hypothetical protein